MTPGRCVPHPICGGDEDDWDGEDGGVGEGEGEGEGGIVDEDGCAAKDDVVT